jgi:hypothetical protein
MWSLMHHLPGTSNRSLSLNAGGSAAHLAFSIEHLDHPGGTADDTGMNNDDQERSLALTGSLSESTRSNGAWNRA